ncbi:MAG: hypothetical protein ACOH2G_06280 [Ewingella sp.]
MSFTKRHLEEVQAEQEMREWIVDQGDGFMVEGDEEWKALEARYLSGNTELDNYSPYDWDDEVYDLEINWTKEQKAFPTFKSQIEEVRENLNVKSSNITLKMNYSFSVTLMESCLGDMLRGVVFSDSYYLLNAIKNIDELKKCKITLLEIYETEELVSKIILKILTEEYTYHNIQKTISIYENVLRTQLSELVKVKIGEMIKIVEVRHDIVHRNGFTTEGEEHVFNYRNVCKAIDHIVCFVTAMKGYIDATEGKRVLSSISAI